MFYMKNVSNGKRALLVGIGAVALAFVTLNWALSHVVAGVMLMGVILAKTGPVGFCPLCALAGRKFDRGR